MIFAHDRRKLAQIFIYTIQKYHNFWVLGGFPLDTTKLKLKFFLDVISRHVQLLVKIRAGVFYHNNLKLSAQHEHFRYDKTRLQWTICIID